MSIRGFALTVGLACLPLAVVCSGRKTQTAHHELGCTAPNTSQPSEAAPDRAEAWKSLKSRYWSAERKWNDANNRYCEGYWGWLENQNRTHTSGVLAEYQKIKGAAPEPITPQWLPEFRRQLAACTGTDLEPEIVRNLLMIYGNEQGREEATCQIVPSHFARLWLELYQSFMSRHPEDELIGDWADDALFRSAKLGTEEKLVATLEGLVRLQPRAGSTPGIRLALARRAEQNGDLVAARAGFEEIRKLFPGSAHAEEAEGALYELDHLQVGMPAPDFTSADLSGKTIRLASLRGKVVLLDFWATCCGPCIGELPTIQNIHERWKAKDFQLIGVSLDDDPQKLTEFLKKKKIDWPQICDFKQFKAELAKLYHVRGIPWTFLIDRQGRIAHKDLRGEELKKAVATMLDE